MYLSDPSQVLMNVLSLRKNMSDSVAYGRLHPDLQSNKLLVDCEFLPISCLVLVLTLPYFTLP